MEERDIALEAIRKKLVGKKLGYREIYAIMDEIAKERLGEVLTTYFVASGYSKGFSNEEIFYLTRAMVETGERLHFKGIVADKHSIGGRPGSRISLIIVPIIAAAGFKIPKSSSRAITTPSGTADAMEVLAPVSFKKEEIYKIVEKTNGCLVWGGGLDIAPADDEIIKVEEPLLFESYDKILVSVMAKKIAFGATHVVIDLPYGKSVKVHRIEDALELEAKFAYLAKRFGIKLKVIIHHVREPAGFGIGPLLEARDALLVLEQKRDRPRKLEENAIELCGVLLDLCLQDASSDLRLEVQKKYRNTKHWAREILASGKALAKMREIIKAQGGNPNVSSADLLPGKFSHSYKAEKSGRVVEIDNRYITQIAKILGCPKAKKAGVYLHKKSGEFVERGEPLFTLYAEDKYLIHEAISSVDLFPFYKIKS